MALLKISDLALTFIHCLLIVFNLFGWCFKKTRKANLLCLFLTFSSWVGLGFYYGWGYCFLTDWHWRIKEKLGATSLPNSFIKYLVDNIFSVDSNPWWIDVATLAFFLVAILCSLWVNRRLH
ncbi:MAG: hypothetical protein A2X86_06140 [Bdellovibrionales bacterium GWA2_49_15]|nr:MAG: hypothetical protein A2X86_06140 [Bdellovibrionales bacterium GWA2_49_15]HAZ14642.1 DUF2784 domain-containing protein [Bdellovibrionales bacterium]